VTTAYLPGAVTPSYLRMRGRGGMSLVCMGALGKVLGRSYTPVGCSPAEWMWSGDGNPATYISGNEARTGYSAEHYFSLPMGSRGEC